MANHAAITGIGQTKYDAKRVDVSQVGLIREAALRALEDAGLTWKDIDAVVIGKAPDMFEGVMMPELFLADALGGAGKPMLRVHTAGSVGGTTAIVAASLVQAGIHDRVLTVTYEKQSESNAMWALSIKIPFQQGVVAGAGGYFAPLIRGYMRRHGPPEDTGIRVALKDRQNALNNPYAHLKFPDIDFDQIKNSPMLWDPIRFLETCPSSDGACALVIGNQKAAQAATSASGTKPAWIHATAMKSEPTMFSGRDQVNPQAGRDCAKELYKKAGIQNPRQEIDCCEIYVPFSWFEPMWMENLHFAPEGEGWKMTYEGATALDGDLPVNMSGGVLSSNPIGASGMLRFAEAAMQIREQAGAHQVDGAKKTLGHAYGGGSQFFSMWIVADNPL
jgi:acetyl-CoA C-acetyltransferase